ncbi:non-ribosomal peptide synthetase [Streptomyces sp. SBT349]|uniref:non-ribosomal peptide synthetase n=1 Tax=Streptomyces sp. SBT349 TaxID=1580539 RepID=UPI001F40CF46|nr:non-ribosomal peptide synthetase [Streptomyces sp. SBT349]
MPYRPITVADDAGSGGRRELAEFVESYCARTPGSKRLAARHRPRLADNDNRVLSDFHMSVKEMLYPVAADRSRGSRLWDVDGNEYIDVVMGYGVNLFGHSPGFVTDAIREQLDRGVHVGVQSPLSGAVAALLCEQTAMARVAFCNSGSEAVMTALRLARAATGRTLVAMFAGSYHGVFDGTLGRRRRLRPDAPTTPIAPGVPQHMVDDLLVLDYDDPRSLEVVAARGHELAAVLVEPVQSRRPDVRPAAFLRRLRELTEASGTALVFDEVITGFRSHPGGAQALFGVRADLATYGKVIGGGLPIGAVAGDARFLDAIDGGAWRYGDDSYPAADTTFFAGTFCKHPLAMAGAHAVLTELARRGPGLQEELNQRTTAMADRLNDVFEAEAVPISAVHFGSLFRFASGQDIHLLYHHLVHRGIHMREGHNAFLSTAHTDEDIDRIVVSVRESVAALRTMGRLPSSPPGSTAYAVTGGQRPLLSLAALDPEGSAAYHQTTALRLNGPLDTSMLGRALHRVVDRHEALRTVFDAEHGTQRAVRRSGPGLPVTERPGAVTGDLLAEIAAEERRPFDLARGPLLRARLVRLGEDSHLFVLTAHHIVADGWSLGLLLEEITASYAAQRRGEDDERPAPVTFRQYASWLERRLTDPRHEAYWTERLRGPLPVLDLPTDHPRPAVRTFGGARHTVTVDAELLGRLREVATRSGSTPFMLLLTAYQALLHRLTGQDDLVVGVPVAARTMPGSERMVGHGTNLLPLRSRLGGRMAFRELLAQCREHLLDAYEHQEFPLSAMVDRLGITLDPARSPLVEAVFNLDRPAVLPRLDGVDAERARLPVAHAQFDLSLNAVQEDGGLVLDFDYRTDLFDAGTIAWWARHYVNLLGDVADRPGAPLDGLALLTAAERERVLRRWNDSGDPGRPACLHELFTAQAARTPDAVCVTHGGRRLTYREADRRSDQLGRLLRARGVRADEAVAVAAGRSVTSVVAVLGILKAGAAWLPLDPGEPAPRLARTLGDSGARLVLAEKRHAGAVSATATATPVIVLDDAWSVLDDVDDAPLPGVTTPANAAYVLYTSGSEGARKGVVGTHEGVVNRLRWMAETYPYAPGEVACQRVAGTFVDAVAELFGPLLAGVPLAVLDEDTTADASRLVRALREERVTRLVVVPSLLRVLLVALEASAEGLPALRCVTVSGETLPPDLLPRFRELLPRARLLNLYGSTEVAADATWYDAGTAASPAPAGEVTRSVPIGRPLTGLRVHLLDGAAGPVPVGAPGELCVGGPGLARGYLNDPARTAERFVPDPFATEPGARLYRTGDLARYRADGTLELLGRADAQVKVRGVRVEPAEIEAALVRHPRVTAAAVTAAEAGGEPRLVAHVVAEEGTEDRALRRFLAERLPAALLPAAYVFTGALPLTPSGKTDRRALAASPGAPLPRPAEAEPLTGTERRLRTLWAEELGTTAVPLGASLFDLGGSSLTAMRLALRIQAACDVAVDARELFTAPSVAAMAALVDERAGSGPAALIPRHAGDGPAPLSFAQQRLWFLQQYQPDSPALNLPYALRLRGPLDVGALERALTRATTRHDVLHTSFPVVDGQPVQVAGEPGPVELPVTDLSGLPEAERPEEALRLARQEAGRPFDLAADPALRMRLIRLGADEHLLVVVLHHVVADGWSLRVLVDDISRCYADGDGDVLGDPPAAPVRYADYAAWQRETLTDERLAAGLAYWREELAGAPTLLDLPTDRPRTPGAGAPAGLRQITVSRELTARIRDMAREEGVTVFMVLVAAFSAVLSRYAGQREVCVGTPVANRERAETERLVGFFANTLVLRTDVSGGVSFTELLGRVRRTVLGAFEHRTVPFERLVEELRPERDLSHTPLFQAMLMLHDEPLAPAGLPGLEVSPLTLTNGAAKYEVSLELTDEPGGLTGLLEYDAGLFDAATMDRFARHLETFLRSAVAEPDRPVADMRLLDEAERARILVEWNDTARGAPPEETVPALIARQAAAAPDRLAARCLDREITYGELERRARGVARALRGRGVGREDVVAVLADRDIDYLVVLLGVLRTGAAFLPADPRQPLHRTAEVVRRGRSALVLAGGERAGEVAAALGADAGPPVVPLAEVCAAPEGGADAEPGAPACRPEGLAYVLFTSGSTGVPKGAMVEHLGMTNHVRAKIADLGITAADVVAQNGPQSFDVSIWQFLAALTAGAAIEILPDEIADDPARLLTWTERRGVTVLQVVPSMMRALLDEAGQLGDRCPPLSALRWLVPTGDALMASSAREWLARWPGVPLLNTYGATECSDDQCHVAIGEAGQLDGSPPIVTIGRPIAHMRAYVLDPRLAPAPVGVPGELYLSGVGVGRGYLADPRRTGETFLPDPFSAEPGARMYRTRDRVRRHADGTIEFLGRTDNLIKVRGLRVEPGEIEAALERHPAVREALVVARRDDRGEARLAGYVVADPAPGPDGDGDGGEGGGDARLAAELTRFLRERLPASMVPGVLVRLDAFPLNANGKVDRAALPEAADGSPARAPFVAPRTDTERAVAAIWAEVLRRERIGADDRFFELGGHSLMATRVVSRIRQRLGVDLPLRVMFDTDSVAGLATEIERRLGEEAEDAEEDLATMVAAVEGLSDEEVARMLRERGQS